MKKSIVTTPFERMQKKVYDRTVFLSKSFPKLIVPAVAMMAVAGSLVPHDAFAALPTADTGLMPDNITGTDSMTQGAQLLEMLFKLIAICLGAACLIVPGLSIVKSFKDRKNGDNSDFHGTVIGGLFVVVIGVGIAITAFSYAGGLAAQALALG